MMIEGDGYGFFRGAVVMSASALESSLRVAVGPAGVERAERGAGRNRDCSICWSMRQTRLRLWEHESVIERSLYSWGIHEESSRNEQGLLTRIWSCR
jgi:hypothetical protein